MLMFNDNTNSNTSEIDNHNNTNKEDGKNTTHLNNTGVENHLNQANHHQSSHNTVNNSNNNDNLGPDIEVWGVLKNKTHPNDHQLTHRLKDNRRDTYILGRSKTCDVIVPHSKVSANHCFIYCDYESARLRVFVEDCSTYGKYCVYMYVRVCMCIL